MVKSFSYILIAVLLPVWLPAQDSKRLDLQQAYELSRNNYPIIQQKDLIRKTAASVTDFLRMIISLSD